MSTTVATILHSLETICPTQNAFAFDHIGLQIGDPDQSVSKAIVTFDASLFSVREAVDFQAQLIVAHHPVIWDALSELTTRSFNSKRAFEIARHNISFIAAHTNWDASLGGLNDYLAEKLKLSDVQPVGSAADVELVKLVVFVPKFSLEEMLNKLDEAGIGKLGNYSRCAYFGSGTGTFTGNEKSNPTVGQRLVPEYVDEFRLEMLIPASLKAKASEVIESSHPYEKPAYEFTRLESGSATAISRIGKLQKSMSLIEFRREIDVSLRTRSMVWGDSQKQISRVAVCGGSADGEWQAAQDAGADVLVTGEVRQHIALEASESGFCIVAAGHYATEHPSCERLCKTLSQRHPEIEWKLATPDPGHSGRPLE